MNIHGRNVLIRALEWEDMPFLMKWHNDPEVAGMLVGRSFPISMAEQKLWFERSLGDSSTRRFAVVAKDQDRLIGMTGLWGVDWGNREAESAIIIGEPIRGRGYGTDTIFAMMDYAFNQMGLNRLWAEMLCFNEASYRLYTRKCGWVQEGILRKRVFRNGQFHDTYRVAILRDEYEALAREAVRP